MDQDVYVSLGCNVFEKGKNSSLTVFFFFHLISWVLEGYLTEHFFSVFKSGFFWNIISKHKYIYEEAKTIFGSKVFKHFLSLWPQNSVLENCMVEKIFSWVSTHQEPILALASRRQLHKNVESNIEQVLAATPHKAPTIRPPASHHENYTS